MDFGKLDKIHKVDFTLPKDHPSTARFLKKLRTPKKQPFKMYLGCAKWGRPDWVGKLYPPKTKPASFLDHYVKQYNSIELNAMFYNLQPKEVITKWAALAANDFRFCPKFSNNITHLRQLRNAELPTDKYIDHMMSFGEKLGPCFIQLSDRFAPNRAEVIADYLKKLPQDFRTVIELRNPQWFLKDKIVDQTFDLFAELGIGSIITDTSGRRDCLHMRVTAPLTFIRWVGNDMDKTDFARIDSWVQRIKRWKDMGLPEAYFFIHTHNEKYSPELSKYAAEQFNLHCGTELKVPEILRPPVVKKKKALPKKKGGISKVSQSKNKSSMNAKTNSSRNSIANQQAKKGMIAGSFPKSKNKQSGLTVVKPRAAVVFGASPVSVQKLRVLKSRKTR